MSFQAPTREATRQVPWTPQDDVLLVRAAQTGDPVSFDLLYRRHARIVHGVLIGRATREDVEDLVQEVFLTAWRQLATLRDPAAFGGWVLTIARHLRIDHGRRQRPQQSLEASPEPQTDADALHRLEAQRALAAIRELPAAYRDTLTLRLVEGLTGPEIASRTGLGPDSVRVNLCRGMKLLRQVLTSPAARTR